MKRWEHFFHEADVGVRGVGDSLEEAFEAAAIGLTAIVTDPSLVATRLEIPLRCQGSSPELLFVDWLNAVIYEMAIRQMLFAEFKVEISPLGISAVAKGEGVDRLRHQPAVEPKGATFTELSVKRIGHQWIAQCVVDV